YSFQFAYWGGFMKKVAFQIAVLCSLFTLVSVKGLSQTFGEITGHVSDSSGAAAFEASISITNVSTNAVRQTVSNEAGDYSFPSLAPGLYNVKVGKQGFKTAESNGVQVQVQQTVRLDFNLQLGQVSESVLVEATAAQLQLDNTTVGTVIENKR